MNLRMMKILIFLFNYPIYVLDPLTWPFDEIYKIKVYIGT